MENNNVNCRSCLKFVSSLLLLKNVVTSDLKSMKKEKPSTTK